MGERRRGARLGRASVGFVGHRANRNDVPLRVRERRRTRRVCCVGCAGRRENSGSRLLSRHDRGGGRFVGCLQSIFFSIAHWKDLVADENAAGGPAALMGGEGGDARLELGRTTGCKRQRRTVVCPRTPPGRTWTFLSCVRRSQTSWGQLLGCCARVRGWFR